MMNTLCNIWLVNIIECVISICLYVSVCVCLLYRCNTAAKSLLALGYSLQPRTPWGHQIGDTSPISVTVALASNQMGDTLS
jgi:hypothetical protein